MVSLLFTGVGCTRTDLTRLENSSPAPPKRAGHPAARTEPDVGRFAAIDPRTTWRDHRPDGATARDLAQLASDTESPVGWLGRREPLLIVALCFAVPGIMLALGATFMPWLQEVFGSHQSFTGWDVVSTNVWAPGQQGVGIHWLVTQSWADEPAKTAFTALSVVTVCLVAVIGLVVTAAMRNREPARWLTVVSWVPFGAGCLLCLFALANLDAWNGVNWRSKSGVYWLLVAGVLVVVGGIFGALAERSKNLTR